MTLTLNFGKNEKEKIKEAFTAFKKGKTNTRFEEERWRVFDCTVTLYSTGKLVVQGEKKAKVKKFVLEQLAVKEEIILGIDETGRGENFGPLVVAGVLGDRNKLIELRDSKKINQIKKKAGIVSENARAIAIIEFSSSQIDHFRRNGRTMDEIQGKAVKAIVFALNPFNEVQVFVDGKPLKGCNGYNYLVKGDDLNPVIGAASVVAKFARDNSGDKSKRKTWKNSK